MMIQCTDHLTNFGSI